VTRKHPFRPALFRFLEELAANNDRAWFEANKERYEDCVRGPALEFIAACAPLLERISPHVVADPRKQGGSLFRIHRDVRFARDKSPYKTYTGIQFRHAQGRDAHAPGFYLHLEPRQIFLGMGIWRPDAPTARRVREAILADPAGWKRATRSKPFAQAFDLAGDALKRPPAGVAPDHPFVEDLKRKDFIATRHLAPGEVTAPDFERDFAGLCKRGAPFMRFLCGAVGVPF